jgi:hypothetical protein
MHWILQENIFQEAKWPAMVEFMDRVGIPYSIHKVIPFVGDLVPEPVLVDKNVVCFGSYSMRHVAKKNGWTPGVFDLEPQNFQIQREHWGDRMLNFRSTVVKFKDANIEADTFIRPIDDSKQFTGQVFSVEEFYEWKRKICVMDADYGNGLTKETLIQLAPTIKIYAEYRFWVVEGKIVTASQYSRNHRLNVSRNVDPYLYTYAEECIAIWQPHTAFVIDLAETAEGLKIVEINTINSSGFYAADVQAIVSAIDNIGAAT